MAFKLIIFHIFTAMVAVNLIFADEVFENGQQPSFLNFESRQERSAEPQQDDDDESQGRLFFASRVSCNYSTQGGTNCVSCRQSLACYPNNVGRLRTCRGLLRYCNNGRCSFIPGPLCSATTTTTAANTTTTPTTTPTTTTLAE